MSERPIYPTFGAREHWHLADGPEGSPTDQARELERLFRRYQDMPEERCGVPKRLAKAMVFELTSHFADSRRRLPKALLSALAMALDLPDDVLTDPASFFAGVEDTERQRQRHMAMDLDVQHRRRSGALMPLKQLQRELSVALGGNGPVRATLRVWRKEPDYRLFLKVTAGVADS